MLHSYEDPEEAEVEGGRPGWSGGSRLMGTASQSGKMESSGDDGGAGHTLCALTAPELRA